MNFELWNDFWMKLLFYFRHSGHANENREFRSESIPLDAKFRTGNLESNLGIESVSIFIM